MGGPRSAGERAASRALCARRWSRARSRTASIVEQEVVDRTPAGRFAEPEDVARAVVLLCSPDAGFVTAQTLVVDGGYTMYGAAAPASRLPGHRSDDA